MSEPANQLEKTGTKISLSITPVRTIPGPLTNMFQSPLAQISTKVRIEECTSVYRITVNHRMI